MRLGILCFFVALTAGCRCSPSQATPVTLRLKNATTAPVYVDDTDRQLGLTVQRNVNGTFFGFDDTPDCPCLSCETACECKCSAPPVRQVRKVLPGDVFERTWNGVVQVAGTASCGGGSSTQACLVPDNAPPDEELSLELCYQPQVTGIPELPDGGTVEATFPRMGQICVSKTFRPADGVVEVGPNKGAACSQTMPCVGVGELCLAGSCTTGCPENGFPVLGAGWALRIPSPDDQGFFTTSPADAGSKRLSGTGTVSSVVYQGTTLVIRLSRKDVGTGDTLTGAVYLALPPGPLPPLDQGASVQVTLVDGSSKDNPENRALVVRDQAGTLLIAADMAQQGALLSATDTAPFTVTSSAAVLGCRQTECGKQLFFATRFQGPAQASVLDPGKTAVQSTDGQGTYRVLNVFNASYATTPCDLYDFRPWAVWREKVN